MAELRESLVCLCRREARLLSMLPEKYSLCIDGDGVLVEADTFLHERVSRIECGKFFDPTHLVLDDVKELVRLFEFVLMCLGEFVRRHMMDMMPIDSTRDHCVDLCTEIVDVLLEMGHTRAFSYGF